MSAPITDADRETARLAVSLVLKDEEAAWEPVAQLIADHTAPLREQNDRMRDALNRRH